MSFIVVAIITIIESKALYFGLIHWPSNKAWTCGQYANLLVLKMQKKRRVKTANLLFCYDRTGRKGALLHRMWKEIEGL